MNELYHHGVKGMHWGVRRYQNEDGSLTEKGKKRYGINDTDSKEVTAVKTAKANYKLAKKQYSKDYNDFYYKSFPFTKQGQINSNKRFMKATLSAGEMHIKKEEYKRLKASLVGDTRKAEIAKRKIAMYKTTNAYNMKYSDMIDKGYTMFELDRKFTNDGTIDKYRTRYKEQRNELKEYKRNSR